MSREQYKKRNTDSYHRKIGTRGLPRKRILIVCEGEKTEPNYFEKFEVTSCRLVVVGTGFNTESLVKKAIELGSKAKKDKEPFDELWTVFDRDSFTAEIFNKAIVLAKKSGIKLAYSNEAFELWYLLHFHYIDMALSREQYMVKLDEFMKPDKLKYRKNMDEAYDYFKNKQPQAIRNAEMLMNKYKPHNPEKDNPCTKVYELVNLLNENSKKV